MKCDTCLGYGIWAIGAPIAMSQKDALDRFPTTLCPQCGANANPSPYIERDSDAQFEVSTDTEALAMAFHFLQNYILECVKASTEPRSPAPALSILEQAAAEWGRAVPLSKEAYYSLATVFLRNKDAYYRTSAK